MPISLEDKYEATSGRVFVTGSQALARLPIDQARRDAAAGLNTAGFISGYRGSPLGNYDLALWHAERHLTANRIRFQPGVNEDLAAASVWGSQQVPFLEGARYDGVFALWYGKGPGVDRSTDAMKHGNFYGSHQKGGVLALCGDDPGGRSSTLHHQSEHALIHMGMPILHPADIQEYLDFGLFGFALSRYSGCWIGFKCVTDTVDGSASVAVGLDRVRLVVPTDYERPVRGLNISFDLADRKLGEAVLFEHRLQAAQAYVRANNIDKVRLGGSGRKRLGIVSTGKSYLDVVEAVSRLGITAADAEALGIGVYKVGMSWPLEPERLKDFASQCDELLVVEEKRPVIEEQVAYQLFNLPADQRPRLTGKRGFAGQPLLSEVGELAPDDIMRVIAASYLRTNDSAQIAARFAQVLGDASAQEPAAATEAVRPAAFCAGCPHNTSTKVPDGSVAMGGIGCHGMAIAMPERKTLGLYHMGGEGAPWIGQAPFVDLPHIFQNMGDGTYFHSGLLALRACVAANVNITYKILLNGAVGMTGGQPIEGEQFAGEITAPHVAQQVHAEGVARIAVVTDDLEKFGDRKDFPHITTFHHRDDLDAVQREIREWQGVSVLIYDQSCATERRRLRKRGKLAAATERLYIQPDVCEGCGDCGTQSSCIAIEPLETELGRKRQINQSACNQDYSCLKGFCPSFVTVTGGRVRRGGGKGGLEHDPVTALPEPTIPVVDHTFGLLITGIGGSGVVTVGAIFGMAARIEDKRATVLDMSGFAQRNGSVMSHVRLAASDNREHAARIPSASADLVLGCDPIVAASPEAQSMMAPRRSVVVLNNFVAPTSAFSTNPDFRTNLGGLAAAIARRVGAANLHKVDATQMATLLLGDAIGANLFLVGYAWQQGLVPLQRASIEQAIALNGSATAMNLRAFGLGRLAAARPDQLDAMIGNRKVRNADVAEDLTAILASRTKHLTAYQNAELAQRYGALVDRVNAAEQALYPRRTGLAVAVARGYARLLAYKDEYEVARLYADATFREGLEANFEGDYKIRLNLAPPLVARRNPGTGRLNKIEFGPWILKLFKVMAPLKILRGTPFDIFGYGPHRRLERELIREYEELVEKILRDMTGSNHQEAVKLADLANQIRGYDVVKEESVARVRQLWTMALARFDAASAHVSGATPLELEAIS